jgi:hypothetical protein
MGRIDGDFEKCEADGTIDALALIRAAAAAWMRDRSTVHKPTAQPV